LVHVSTVDTLGCGSRRDPADEETPGGQSVECPYVVTKRGGEQVVLELVRQDLDAVVVNPAFVLGPWDWKPSSGRMLLAVGRGRALVAPPGGNDFCDARDVASGILKAAERGVAGRRYILGGEPLSYFEAFSLFAEITGRRPPIRVMRVPVLRTLGALGSFWGRLTGREPALNDAAAAMALVEHHFSVARAAGELGYQVRSAREAGLAAWEWFLDHGYAASKSRPVGLRAAG
ncbi:MAG TPA: NAD-dependent epimerase/dehydratase family protein, partial [Pirellulales bacterium]|nr:NAD-dependent epimerase/dehydratase family protein [Pirellulales bacterium]